MELKIGGFNSLNGAINIFKVSSFLNQDESFNSLNGAINISFIHCFKTNV